MMTDYQFCAAMQKSVLFFLPRFGIECIEISLTLYSLCKLTNLACNSANEPSFQNKKPFCTMIHRCDKCHDIFKVASVGGGEIANLKACNF